MDLKTFIVLGVVVLLFMIFRSFTLWYWKIDELVENQKEMIRLLKKQVDEE